MGVVTRVSGPLVEVTGLDQLAMLEVVEVGPRRLPAETVSIEAGVATLQAYEYTGGLRVGDSATAVGAPLSVPLGPHLLGGVFDGLLRPLAQAPAWLTTQQREAAADERRWAFTPHAELDDAMVPGRLLGVVAGAGAVEHRVLVPPGIRGRLEWLSSDGTVAADDAVARISGHEVRLTERWPVRRPRPYAERLEDIEPLVTGQRVIDLLFPLARGGVAGVPGGFGTGKTVLLQQLAKWCDAEVIVYVGCGERGNEMADVLAELAELTDPRTGGRLLDRAVIIANTSNMPMMAREASIYTGITVAEYYRDMGYHTVVIADSTSRWAEALREFASRTGALPAEEGYPAELPSALAAFYGRAGRVRTLGGQPASVTVVGAVSPPGGDMTEPVTTTTLRFVRSVWLLDRDLAYSRHYPAVSWSGSFCRDAEGIGNWHAVHDNDAWVTRRARVLALLAEADRLAALAELLGEGALPGHERMVILAARLIRDGVLRQSALSQNDAYCSPEKGAALLDLSLALSEGLQRLIEQGVPATTLEALDLSAAVRSAEETAPDDAAGVASRREDILRRLEDVQ